MIRRPPRSPLFPYTPLSRSEPGPPGLLRRAHAQLLLVADQRHPEEQGLQRELLEPAVFREQRRLQTELREALRLPVDQGRHPADRKSTRLNSSHSPISYAVF